MKRAEFITKIKDLIKDTDFKKCLERGIKHLVDSGAIDYEAEESNSFGLAKVVLCVALENLSEQYSPFSKSYKDEIQNLRKF